MPNCSPFTVKVKDVSKAIKKAREGFKKKGGTFKGDDTKGTYKISGDGFLSGKYTVEGSYSVSGKDVTIKNKLTADRPIVVTCKAAEEKMREYF